MQQQAARVLKLIGEDPIQWDQVAKAINELAGAENTASFVLKDIPQKLSGELPTLLGTDQPLTCKALMQAVVNKCLEKACLYISKQLEQENIFGGEKTVAEGKLKAVETLITRALPEWLPLADAGKVIQIDDESKSLGLALKDLQALYQRRQTVVSAMASKTQEDVFVAQVLELFWESKTTLTFLQEKNQSAEKFLAADEYARVNSLFTKFSQLNKNLDEDKTKRLRSVANSLDVVAQEYASKALGAVRVNLGLAENQNFSKSGVDSTSKPTDSTMRAVDHQEAEQYLKTVQGLTIDQVNLAISILESLNTALAASKASTNQNFYQKHGGDVEQLTLSCRAVIQRKTPVSQDISSELKTLQDDFQQFKSKFSDLDSEDAHKEIYRLFTRYSQLKQKLVTEYPMYSKLNAFVAFFKDFYEALQRVFEQYAPVALAKVAQALDTGVVAKLIGTVKSVISSSENDQYILSMIVQVCEMVSAIPEWTMQYQRIGGDNGPKLMAKVTELKRCLLTSSINLPPNSVNPLIKDALKLEVIRSKELSAKEMKESVDEGFKQIKQKAFIGAVQALVFTESNTDVLRFQMQSVLRTYADLVQFNIVPNFTTLLSTDTKNYKNLDAEFKDKILQYMRVSIVKINSMLGRFKAGQEVGLESAIFLTNEIELLEKIVKTLPGLEAQLVVIEQNNAPDLNSSAAQSDNWTYVPEIKALETGKNKIEIVVGELVQDHLPRFKKDSAVRGNAKLAGSATAALLHGASGGISTFNDNTVSSSRLSTIAAAPVVEKLNKVFEKILAQPNFAVCEQLKTTLEKIKSEMSDAVKNEKMDFPMRQKADGKWTVVSKPVIEITEFVEEQLNTATASAKKLKEQEEARLAAEREKAAKKQAAQDKFCADMRTAYQLLADYGATANSIEAAMSAVLISTVALEKLSLINETFQLKAEENERPNKSRVALLLDVESISTVPTTSESLSDHLQMLLSAFCDQVTSNLVALQSSASLTTNQLVKCESLTTYLNDNLLQNDDLISLLGSKKNVIDGKVKDLVTKVAAAKKEQAIRVAKTEMKTIVEALATIELDVITPVETNLNALNAHYQTLVSNKQDVELESSMKDGLIKLFARVCQKLQTTIDNAWSKPKKVTDVITNNEVIKKIQSLSDLLVFIKEKFGSVVDQSLVINDKKLCIVICQLLYNQTKVQPIDNVKLCNTLLNLLADTCEKTDLSGQKIEVVTQVNDWFPNDKENQTLKSWRREFDKKLPDVQFDSKLRAIPINTSEPVAPTGGQVVFPAPVSQPQPVLPSTSATTTPSGLALLGTITNTFTNTFK